MSSAITIGDPVRVTAPTSLSGSRVGTVAEIANFVNSPRCRYLLKFAGSHVPLWYFDYEVEPAGEQELFSDGDLVQCPGFRTMYVVVRADPEARMVDVRALDEHATLFRNFPFDMFKLYTVPDEAKCSACGQTIDHSAQ